MKKIGTFLGKHKKLFIVLAVLLVLAVAWSVYSRQMQATAAAAMQAQVQTFQLQKSDLAQSLSVNGQVQSGKTAQAATSLVYPVKEVLVKVGDTVAEGDLLATLDTTQLDEQIKTQQAALASEKQQSDLSIAQAQRRLEDVRNSKKITEERMADADEATRNDALRQASLAIEDAQDALTNLVTGSKAPSAAAQQLKELKRQKTQCEITAPAAGTITVLNAVEGAPATAIATIEDEAALEIAGQVREYDVNKIKPGQKITLVSGAKDSFTGAVSWVAPKSVITGSGESMYEVRFSIDNATSALRLGMTARVKVILEEKKGVFSVPLDAVGTDAEGNAVVYAKTTDAEGKISFEPVPVTTGMETDLLVEISGAGLSEGMELRSLAESSAAGMGGMMIGG